MPQTSPSVFLLARPAVDADAMRAYLDDVGGSSWLEGREAEAGTAMNGGQLLVEFAGRVCYRSWQPGLNPNVSRVRTDQREYFGNLLRSLHGSVLEHANYSFAFRNVSRVFCYDADTDVLTSEGWKRWPDVDGTEIFATLNPETDQLEYQEAEERFEGDYDGAMYRVRSEQVDLLVTPQHRMWIQRHDTQAARREEQRYGVELAGEIAGKPVAYQKAARWAGVEEGVVELPASGSPPEREDGRAVAIRARPAAAFGLRAFARFLGRYLAGGSLGKHVISIAQPPGARADEIAATIQDLGLTVLRAPACVRTYDPALHDFLGTLGRQPHERRVPAMVHEWGPKTIRELLGAYLGGDGTHRRDGGRLITHTASSELAEDLQVLALKAGWSADVRRDDGAHPGPAAAGGAISRDRRPGHVVSLVKGRTGALVNHDPASPHDSWQHYKGKVYCVKVPNGLLFVRRNGKPVVSGNTHELVRHRAGSAFSQESLRYVRLTDIGFRVPPALEPVRDEVLSLVERLEEFQVSAAEELGLDEEGIPFSVKKEVTSALRRLAPIGLSTDIVWTANARTLRHVIEMRTAEGAEEELRAVFDKVAEAMCEEAPGLFQDFRRSGDGSWVPEHRKV